MRVLTMNALAPVHADWPQRKPLLVNGIRQLAPDIVALQEVAVDHVDELLDGDWRIAAHPGRDADGVGAVLASRWPLLEVHHHDLQLTDRTSAFAWTGVVAARVDAPSPLGPVLAVHHKPVWAYDCEYERERQAVAMTRFVDEVAGDARHVIVLGDLDAAPHHASIRYLTGRQSLEGSSVSYRDVWEQTHPGEPGLTFAPDNPLVPIGTMPAELGRRIDYILVRGDGHGPTLQPTACGRVLVDPVAGVQASDHYGLTADLTLPDHPPGEWA
jgi:endonuclease/exonuclease/phosphatase family metal-dependent hydrolase